MRTNKLGKKQRIILKAMADACAPVCATNLPDIFRNDGDQRRFLEILVRRGFITIERRHFLRITDKGKTLITEGEPC